MNRIATHWGRWAVPLGVSFLVLACGNRGMHGTVLDPFGDGVEGVVVDIVGTKFSATTGRDGHYSLDYAPGEFTVEFRREGYTSTSKTFTVSQKGPLPVEDVVLYPVPDEPGIYYLGEALEPTSRTRIERQDQQGPWSARYKYYAANTEHLLTVPQGSIAFLDADDGDQRLVALRGDGLILDVTFHLMTPQVHYGDFREDESTAFEEENLWLRQADLAPGMYAWVDIGGGPVLGSRAPGEKAYLFEVEGQEEAHTE